MKNWITLMLIGILCCTSTQMAAQSQCKDYHKFNCPTSSDSRFEINGQSRSAMVQVGVPTDFSIIVYKGQDYRISFCRDEKIIGEHVLFRLVEKNRVPVDVIEKTIETYPVVDENGELTGTTREETIEEPKTIFDDTENVLWDNTEHDMEQEVEFTCTATKRLIINVTAPGPVEGSSKNSKEIKDIGCVGVLIEHMTSPEVGF